MPYCNIKKFKNEIFGNSWPLIEHGPDWINFTIFTFISEKNRYFICLYKKNLKIILFDVKKKI
jgi:hypothetical protein